MGKITIVALLSFLLGFPTSQTTVFAKRNASKNNQLKGNIKKSRKKIAEVVESGPRQALLVDFDTEDRLHEKNADERCAPSSMTKLMTVYLLFEAIEGGRLKFTDELPVSEFAQSKEGSRSFFRAGSLAKVEDLVRSIIVHSGNDACTIVAEKLAGDEEAFAVLMNEKAEAFGLKNTNFKNASGLPHEEHYSSVNDLAMLARRLLKDFPQHYHYFSEKEFEVNGIFQKNRNILLGNNLNVDGLKTGETSAGGAGMVVSAKKDGKRLIGVVNGCKSVRERAREANRLLAFGFREYIPLKVAIAYGPIGSAAVILGKSDHVDVCTHEDISIFVLKKYKNDVVVELSLEEPAEAPLVAGTKLGSLVFRYGKVISGKYDLFARETVERVTFWERIGAFFTSLFTSEKSSVSSPGKVGGGAGGAGGGKAGGNAGGKAGNSVGIDVDGDNASGTGGGDDAGKAISESVPG
ncbi:MAG: D-alanyl-D-alanine carboxypeptidase [Holosporaceae bacterium]|jgi:D-alanyl-D-alanine carboxypeptidase (penicillin-binding protein 5/6)|nr:D-alanyl-D-alanine carboxypeptidase [Holosporaceae bacterium]